MVLKLRLVGVDEGKALLLEDAGVPDEADLLEDVGEAELAELGAEVDDIEATGRGGKTARMENCWTL